MLAGTHPGMVADDLADYLFARSTGHFASLMTLITRGCRRAVRAGTEKLTRDLLDQVRNDAAAEAARQELLAAFDAGRLSARPAAAPALPGRNPGSGRLRSLMAAIPIRLPPLPGEALDSWLETYAHLLHVAVRDIFALAGVDWDRWPATTSASTSRGSTSWTSRTWPRSAPSPGSPPRPWRT